jgi:hypothetical protein
LRHACRITIRLQMTHTQPRSFGIFFLSDAAGNPEQIGQPQNGRHLHPGIEQDSDPRICHLSLLPLILSISPMAITIVRIDIWRNEIQLK